MAIVTIIFYSFIHNNLQTDFRKYGKNLNELSLIANYEDAQYVIHLIDNQKDRGRRDIVVSVANVEVFIIYKLETKQSL